jgi:acetyltransferase-like isoleucine patch superfamily enzyme
MPGPKITIGDWANVGFETFIGAKQEMSIGDFTVIAPRCYFVDVDHGFDPDDVILAQLSEFAPVRIGRDCYFGTGTIVTKGVEVGDGALVGANSVVTQSIGPYEVWAGTPAR